MLMFIQVNENGYVAINHVVAVEYTAATPEQTNKDPYCFHHATPEELIVITDIEEFDYRVVGKYVQPILDMVKSRLLQE